MIVSICVPETVLSTEFMTVILPKPSAICVRDGSSFYITPKAVLKSLQTEYENNDILKCVSRKNCNLNLHQGKMVSIHPKPSLWGVTTPVPVDLG